MSTPQNPELEQKLKELRRLFADGPEIGKGRIGERNPEHDGRGAFGPGGKRGTSRPPARSGVGVDVIAPFAEGGAERLRGVLELLNGHFEGAEKVGTVHDMRFVFLDDDSKLLLRHRL